MSFERGQLLLPKSSEIMQGTVDSEIRAISLQPEGTVKPKRLDWGQSQETKEVVRGRSDCNVTIST